MCQQISEGCKFDTSNKDTPVHLMSSKKRKTRGKNDNMEQMASTTVKLDLEVNYVEQIAANVKQLDEFHAMIFELEYNLVDNKGNSNWRTNI